jgi:serine/threonine protein kinase
MGVCRDLNEMEGNLGLIFEMMETGSLHHILHGVSLDALAKRPSSHLTRLRYCLEIADGMRFLHHSQVLHQDLRSGNILIDRDGRCKIADFWLSTLEESPTITSSAWTAPEVISGIPFSLI